MMAEPAHALKHIGKKHKANVKTKFCKEPFSSSRFTDRMLVQRNIDCR